MEIDKRIEKDILSRFVIENNLGDIHFDYEIKRLNTIKTGGVAKYFYEPNNVRSLIKFMRYIKGKYLYYIFGLGSNILASSKYYKGIIISLRKIKKWYMIKDNNLYVSASYSLMELANKLAKDNYTNLEFYASIPGSIGGAIYMNAGAFKKETKDYLKEVVIYDNGKIVVLKKDEIVFDYRKSNLGKVIVLSAVYEIKKTDMNVFDTINKHIEIRKNSQPIGPSCGSVFKNPTPLFAWELIDEIGMRNKEVNGICFSNKHANFIINNNNCDGENILELITQAQYLVYQRYKIFLESEIVLFNF